MKRGEVVRIKMDTVLPIYYKFSLNGFSKSFEWLKKCCYKNSSPHLNTPDKESKHLDRIIKKSTEKDEDYFP